MQTSRQETANTLRSVLLSSRKAIQLDKLQNEYKVLIGAPIPFRELGFKNLEAYLRSIPDVVKVYKNPNGEYVCSPVANSPTAHIAKMVHNQKSSKSSLSSDGPAIPELEVIPGVTKTIVKPPRQATEASTPRLQNQSEKSHQNLQQKINRVKKSTLNTNKEALMKFVTQNHLGEVSYNTKEMRSEKTTCFFSRVKVGTKTFTSFPNEKSTRIESEEEAARCALEDLKAQFEGRNPSELKISSADCLTRRIFDLISEKPNGVWAYHINSTYMNTFGEQLPKNWIEIIESDPKYKVQRINATNIIIFPNINQHSYSIVRRFSDASDASSSDTTDSSTYSQTSPSSLALPSDNYWYVYITQVNSASDVCMRLIGDEYSVKYESLATDMELHYMEIPMKMTEPPSVGNLYAAKVDESWNRVDVVGIISNDTVRCFFVDHGDIDNLKVSVLMPLESRFRSLPFQAVKCKLTGMDGINDFHFNMNLVKLIVGKSFYASVDSRDKDVSITLYDTSSDADTNVNKLAMEMTLGDLQGPVLNAVITEVFLSHILSTCEIYLQIQSFQFKLLENYIGYVTSIPHFQNVRVVEPGKMYLVKYSSHNMYCRAVMDKQSVKDGGTVTVFFVDYGNSETTKSSEILEIPGDCEFLRRIPYQALRCRLNDVPQSLECNVKAIDRLKSLVPKNVSLLAKLISKSGSIPIIELFKRLPDTNELVSVNQTLVHEEMLAKKKDDKPMTQANTKNNESERNLSSSPVTNSVILPTIGEFCDIRVTWAANPFNFMFQLWTCGEAFDKLMIEMQKYYTSKNDALQAPAEKIKNGELYAVFHENIWYRAKTTVNDSILRDKVVPVYFVDYGDHSVVSLDCICYLESVFKTLPFQALRGQLAGIFPANGDWEAEDCMRFKELVEDKALVASVKNYTKNSDGDQSVVLELIDTSVPDKDVYISKILVDERRAIFKDI